MATAAPAPLGREGLRNGGHALPLGLLRGSHGAGPAPPLQYDGAARTAPPLGTTSSGRHGLPSYADCIGTKAVELLEELEREARPSRESSRLKKLGAEAQTLEAELGSLSTQSACFASPVASAMGAASPAPLPRKCREMLDVAAAQDRRAASANRGAQQAAQHVFHSRTEKVSSARCAADAAEAAERRQREAARRLEKLKADRRAAEAEHERQLAEEEARSATELADIERRIEEVRRASDETTRKTRQQVADLQGRKKRNLEQVQAEHERRCRELEAATQQHSEDCQSAIMEAASRKHRADEAAAVAWQAIHEASGFRHARADGEVQEYQECSETKVADTNKKLADHASALELVLGESARRSLELWRDRAAEEGAEVARARADDEISQRRADGEEVRQRSSAEASRLLAGALETGRQAGEDAQKAQEAADAAIAGIRDEVAAFVEKSCEAHICEHWARLNGVAADARRLFAETLERMRQESEREASASFHALLAADHQVEGVRAEARARSGQQLDAVTQGIRSAAESRSAAAEEAARHVRDAQAQMVKYVSTQELELQRGLERTLMPESRESAALVWGSSPSPFSAVADATAESVVFAACG